MDEILVGKRLRIVRDGQAGEVPGRITLIVKRGAFGSGEHETTVSCLEELERLDLEGKSVLDIGCGTGILSIAALKLGADYAVCVDIAREAIDTTSENARLNGLDSRIYPVLGTVDMIPDHLRKPYDVILANIYPEVLRSIVCKVAELSKPGTLFVGSGVMWGDNTEIIELYKKVGFRLLVNRWLEQYTTFVMVREGCL